MKRFPWFYGALFWALLWSGCEKIAIQDPKDKNEAFFTLNFSVNGEEIQLGKGRNDYVKPGFFVDELGIRVFSSTFYTQNELGESNQISIYLRDDRIFNAVNLDTISFFKSGSYAFRSRPAQAQNTEIISNFLENPEQFQNIFWGNSSLYQEERTKTGRFFHQNISNTTQEVVTSAIMKGINDCETFYFKVNRPNLADINFLDFQIEGNRVRPQFSHPDSSGVDFLWLRWEDPDAPSNIHALSELEVVEKGYYGLVMFYNTTDSVTGEEISSQTWIRTYFDFQSGNLKKSECFYPLSSKSLNTFAEDPDFSSVTIEWIDGKGVKYSSDLTEGGASPSFVILENQAFSLQDELGNQVRLLTIEFSCTLTNALGETLQLKNAQGTIAFSY
jgi:hypothetical protein